ncbi:MAG: redoxin domain-containing protein, partial [Negativicoccus succinicivorans]|nr:redoxin domain-containing protein [Negativicoccus succinicivorans]
FYPADFTFVCPTELADLADHYEKLQELGCEVYSVSTDTHFVHMAWAKESPSIQKVQYKMIGDPTGQLARYFDVMNEAEGSAQRGSFVIDPEGVIQALEIHADGIGRNADELVRKVEAAQFVAEHGDQVCPARWHKGAETLKPGKDLVGTI